MMKAKSQRPNRRVKLQEINPWNAQEVIVKTRWSSHRAEVLVIEEVVEEEVVEDEVVEEEEEGWW